MKGDLLLPFISPSVFQRIGFEQKYCRSSVSKRVNEPRREKQYLKTRAGPSGSRSGFLEVPWPVTRVLAPSLFFLKTPPIPFVCTCGDAPGQSGLSPLSQMQHAGFMATLDLPLFMHVLCLCPVL